MDRLAARLVVQFCLSARNTSGEGVETMHFESKQFMAVRQPHENAYQNTARVRRRIAAHSALGQSVPLGH